MPDLKPCPFCGSKDTGVYEIRSENCSTFRYILCRTCGAKSQAFFQERNAVEAWNRRAGKEDKHEAD